MVFNYYCSIFASAFVKKIKTGDKSPLFFWTKMITAEQIKTLVTQKLEGTDCFLVDVHVRPGNRISVYLDKDQGGISIHDCVEVNRFIEKSLDREVEDFELEVSSPGMDQPLKLLRQFRKHIGRKVGVVLFDGRRIEGVLRNADETQLEVEELPAKKSKSTESLQHLLPHNQIKETKLVISFN